MTARFYLQALGLEILASFEDHSGVNGIILGHPGWPYHLELTRRRDRPVMPRPTDEDLLVLYIPQRSRWDAAVQGLEQLGSLPVPSSNPYWDERGLTFVDPDGYRIVLACDAWP